MYFYRVIVSSPDMFLVFALHFLIFASLIMFSVSAKYCFEKCIKIIAHSQQLLLACYSADIFVTTF